MLVAKSAERKAAVKAASMAAHWAVSMAVPRADYWVLRSVAPMEMPRFVLWEQSWAVSKVVQMARMKAAQKE